MSRHPVLRRLYLAAVVFLIVMFIVWIFAWDSLIGWLITKENAELHRLLFWVVFAVVMLIAATIFSLIISKPKK
ncbi:MAG: hypothetical protein FWF49_01575 [Oscillospiraceae bacterium]|nr:hypothetical protein [Oscillospiraceae bacterium]